METFGRGEGGVWRRAPTRRREETFGRGEGGVWRPAATRREDWRPSVAARAGSGDHPTRGVRADLVWSLNHCRVTVRGDTRAGSNANSFEGVLTINNEIARKLVTPEVAAVSIE